MDSQTNATPFLQLLAAQALSRMAIGVILTDRDGRIQWVNDRQQWFTGVPPQGLIGYSLFEHPGLFFEALHDALQFTLVKGKVRQIVLRQHRLHCRIEVSPLTLEGRLLGAAVCFYEMETAAAESAAEDPLTQLVADEQRAMVRLLSSLLDVLPLAVAAVTRDGGVLYTNTPWRSAFAGDVLDRPLAAMLPAAARSEVEEALQACFREGRGRLAGSRAQGAARLFWVAPLQANPELTLGLVAALPEWAEAGTSRDHPALPVTHLGQLVSQIVHDIRNPLTALKCQIEVLRDKKLYEPGGEHVFQETIDLFDKEVREIITILEEIEPIGGGEPGATDSYTLSELVKNAHFVAEWRRPCKEVHIALELPEDLPSITCDGVRFQKALTGLLLEALDQAGAAGRVALRVHTRDDGAIGLRLLHSAARMENRPSRGPSPGGRTCNLRLAMAYAVIVELGGTLEIRRHESGETEIAITLPAVTQTPMEPLGAAPIC